MAVMIRKMTIRTFKERLSTYPDSDLCCGTFWLAEDFMALDNTLDENAIESAMELAEDSHDANIGFNWAHLQAAIEQVKKG